jgi:spore maturation protein CgeB
MAEDAHAIARHVREVSAEEARRIGDRARRRALRDHTYAQRAVLVDSILRSAVEQPVGELR